MFYLNHRFNLADDPIPRSLSHSIHAFVDSLKINSIHEEMRNGRSVFVKHRHIHAAQLTSLANFYFRISRVPIRFQSNIDDWRRWEMESFEMLNGDRFHVRAVDAETIIEDTLPGESLWSHLNRGTVTTRMLQAAGNEFYRAHQFWSEQLNGFWSHGDATASNMIYDSRTNRARLVDFEIVHSNSMSADARQADDLLVFLLDMAGIVSQRQWLPFALCFLEGYPNAKVIDELRKSFSLAGGLAWIWWEVRTNFAAPARIKRSLATLGAAMTTSKPFDRTGEYIGAETAMAMA